MGAPKGNQFAKDSGQGRPKNFETPQDWKEAIQRYFDWCDQNPIIRNEVVKSGQEAGRILPVPTVRPYLLEGLCDFLDISVQSFADYEKNETHKDFFQVSAWARNKVFSQNLTFGYTGAFDAGLVARKLGIADKQEIKAEMEKSLISLSVGSDTLNLSGGKK